MYACFINLFTFQKTEKEKEALEKTKGEHHRDKLLKHYSGVLFLFFDRQLVYLFIYLFIYLLMC